jgi:putative hydroxymethylpyrimidine transport system substrate-binding protein
MGAERAQSARRPAEPDPDHAGEGMQAMPRRLTLFLPLLVLAAACGGADAGATCPTSEADCGASPTEVSLQLDWYPNPDHVGLYTAIDRGFFRNEGLMVTPRPPSDVSDSIKLVAAGRADLGISYEPELFFAQQHDAPVVAVSAIVPTALNSVIAPGGAGIRTPADLRGTTIGVDGSDSTSAYLDTMLRRVGLDPEHDVHTVDVGFNLLPALLGGRVDAIAGGFQNIEGAQLEVRGLDPVVFPVDRYGVPTYDELVVIANSDRLQSDSGYRQTVRAFVAGLAAGTRYAKSHPGAALAAMRTHASSDYKSVLESSVPETLRLLETTSLDPAAWDAFGRWMRAQGLLERAPDGAALVARP